MLKGFARDSKGIQGACVKAILRCCSMQYVHLECARTPLETSKSFYIASSKGTLEGLYKNLKAF